MKERVKRLSHPDYLQHDLNILRNIFVENSYPPRLINKLICNVPFVNRNILTASTMSQPGPLAQSNSAQTSVYFYALPYIPKLTIELSKIFKEFKNIKIANENIKTIRQLYSKMKQPLTTLECTDVVYRIECTECPASYIGETGRNLSSRIISHKSDCRLNKPTCALAEHTIDLDHKIDFNNAKILARESNKFKRTFLEMVHISKSDDNNLNKRSEIQNLSKIYNYILTFD
ncbi:uncharacterized protein LOC126885465 [Diabrotica virgifera virgifera]|uniref:Helix-turn-helix domain-containing protein n=1 Tax=Diabrotica virgifera virgifera TaxID=50390 RepID=A0ABM5KCS3_DIAVI|nr:uncharacterized protein LOC126885465 [Diabrotica virgifera virgifera]